MNAPPGSPHPPGFPTPPRRSFWHRFRQPSRFWDWLHGRNRSQGLDPSYFEAIEKAQGTVPGTTQEAPDGRTSEAIFYESVMQQLERQIRAGDSTDQKIAAVFVLVTAVLPVGAALIQANTAVSKDPVPSLTIVFSVSAVVCWIGAILMLFAAYGPNQWEVGPQLPDFFADSRKYDARTLLDAEAFYIAFISIPRNEAQLRKKARRFNRAIGLFVLEVVCVIFAVVVYLLR